MEGPQKERFPISLFRKNTASIIDLISIGIVTDNDREYHAISKDFNLEEAWNKFTVREGDSRNMYGDKMPYRQYELRENILKPMLWDLYKRDMTTFGSEFGNYNNFIGYMDRKNNSYTLLKRLIRKYGKTNKRIAEDIKTFVYYSSQINDPELIANWEEVKHQFPVEFYYHRDNRAWTELYSNSSGYAWVAFCGLFEKVPKGFPSYYNSLDQMQREHFSIDFELLNYCEAVNDIDKRYPSKKVLQAVFTDEELEKHPKYPGELESNTHNPLEKARWNKLLFNFLSYF